MYKKVSTDLNFVDRELETIDFWKENKIFEKSIDERDACESFTFFEGPPTANGMPHIGHIITRVIKDMIPRYKTMKGYQVLRKAGWDTHGLPVELEVEKTLGIKNKTELEDYGIESFIKKCKESVWKYEKEWREMSDRVGYWIDNEDPYVTYHNNYIESVWWSLKKLWDKDLIYKGFKVVPYCPRCGTALSSHEVAQGYEDITDPSVYAKFKVKNEDNLYFLAWTTTPWTLPSNVSLVVNEKEDYVEVKTSKERYILAKALLESTLEEDYEILREFKGKELVDIEYEPLFRYEEPKEKAWYVVADDYVSLSDGTGIVHSAPAHGEDDNRIGRKFGLPTILLINSEGKFIDTVVDFAGQAVKDADPSIIKKLESENKIYRVEEIEHNYPFCWRCHHALIYYSRDAWFIEMTKVKENLLANNEAINWYPDNVKHGRFGKFLENLVDWNLSRERYWGTPLPIWECENGHRHMIGSIKELKEMGVNVPDDIELHKPYIDEVKIKCPECDSLMTRIDEVIDCWYDSGAMPFAQWHYPFENKEIFDKHFPADFISEAVDQTRGWFYSLLAISTALFDEPAYKNCLVLGHVLDKDGIKMSKHIGNVVDPWEVLNKQGADAVRWYFFSSSAPWLPSRFHDDAVNEAQRKYMGPFWNTYAFYVLYANIDNIDPSKYEFNYDKLPLLDKWVISKLHELNNTVDKALDSYRITEAARAIQAFVDDLSNWYIRRNRERFWAKGMGKDKISAFLTLYNVLIDLAKISAPFVPFMTEEIYQNLVLSVDKNAKESIHLCDWPEYKEQYVDEDLMKNMDLVLKIVTLGRAARNNANIKNRQALSELIVKSKEKLDPSYKYIILEELNVKELKFVEETDKYSSYIYKPQLKTLGPKYGKLLPKISKYLATLKGNEFLEELSKNTVTVSIDNNEVVFEKDDILIESSKVDGYELAEDRLVTVVLNTSLSEELIEEGFVRELVSKLQNMRKDADFEVMDRIIVKHLGNDKIAEILDRNSELIKEEVLCDAIEEGSCSYSKKWDINGEEVTLSIEKSK